jgi:choline dehydrogenase-like flavoprotein
MMDTHGCECLVVGSGPGGAITASVLAEAGRDVLVIEEGKDESGEFLTFSLDEMNRYRYAGVGISRGNPKVFYLEGSCLGGASEINAGLYHRPPQQMLDKWDKEYDIQEFGGVALEPFFEMNEKDLDVRALPSALGPGARIIERGAKNLNWKAMAASRMWDYSGSNPQGQRFSMTRSFIPKAKAAGARFVLGTKVKKINFRSGKAYEALCVSSEGKINTRVRFKSVFVCGGAIQTPLLLRNSALTRNIGERLKIHLSARLVACFDETASDPLEGVPVMQVSEFKPQLTLGGSFTSPAFLASWLAGREDFARIMQSPSDLGIFYASIIAHADGRVRPELFSGEATLSMNIKDDDLCSLGEGIYKLGQMLFASGAKVIYSPVVGQKDFRTLADIGPLRDDLLSYGVDLSTMHLFSSCPMGENLSRCALNSFGQVHGMSNIYVNDASMLPDAPGTNPQSLVMALARRNAMHWLEHGFIQRL